MVYTGNEVHEAETKMYIYTEAAVFYLSFLSWMHVEVKVFSMVQWSIWTSIWYERWNLEMAWKSSLGALPHTDSLTETPPAPQPDSIPSHWRMVWMIQSASCFLG